jgi:hypothetical protein
MKMKIHLTILTFLAILCLAHGEEKSQPEVKVRYNSSGLTVITVESNRLSCTWHTLRKDLMIHRASFESYDKHTSTVSLTDSEANKLLAWSHDAIRTTVTDDQRKSRRGYSTVLSVTIDGKTHNPNHDTIKAFKHIVSVIIKKRRKEEF